jgi:ABC-type phosphate transport system permease subunit
MESIAEMEQNVALIKYKEELVDLHKKSQETFEQQLSYISAGCLALSIGFLKDFVKDIAHAHTRFFLMIGWILMIITLLMNLVSHLLSTGFYEKSISELNNQRFDSNKSDRRFKIVTILNWFCVGSLIVGILFIVVFVYNNL